MREYAKEDGSIIIHVSNLVNFFTCPKSMKLSMEIENEESMAMRDGKLFEAFCFGNKPEDQMKTLIGSKKPVTLEPMKLRAATMRRHFVNCNYNEKFEQKISENIYIQGEYDAVDDFNCIIKDLKTTSDIDKIWNTKSTKIDFLQAIFYTYAKYLETSKVYTFIYHIIELSTGIEKEIVLNFNVTDFDWLERIILDNFSEEQQYYAEPSYANCCKNKYYKSCDYLEYCREGKALYSPNLIITWENLN